MKYLFTALLHDGSVVEQTQEDKSHTTEGKNAFYDVLQKMDQVRAFALYNQETQDEYLIDLEDGRFEVNGASFIMHEEPLTNFRLVYFKRNKISMITGEHYDPLYFIGYQANNAAGQNVQHTLTVT